MTINHTNMLKKVQYKQKILIITIIDEPGVENNLHEPHFVK